MARAAPVQFGDMRVRVLRDAIDCFAEQLLRIPLALFLGPFLAAPPALAPAPTTEAPAPAPAPTSGALGPLLVWAPTKPHKLVRAAPAAAFLLKKSFVRSLNARLARHVALLLGPVARRCVALVPKGTPAPAALPQPPAEAGTGMGSRGLTPAVVLDLVKSTRITVGHLHDIFVSLGLCLAANVVPTADIVHCLPSQCAATVL